jgi:hypothetical protein
MLECMSTYKMKRVHAARSAGVTGRNKASEQTN